MLNTTVMLCRKPIRDRDNDIHRFSTTLTMDEIEKLIRMAEERKAGEKEAAPKRIETSEQVISDIKMHRFERSESWPEKSNAMSAGSNGRSAPTRSTMK